MGGPGEGIPPAAHVSGQQQPGSGQEHQGRVRSLAPLQKAVCPGPGAQRTVSFNFLLDDFFTKIPGRTSLAVHWLRVGLPVQGRWVRSLLWDDPMC